jgi:hypothetical protein
MELKIKNFDQNPGNGGIPAIARSIKLKIIVKNGLITIKELKLIKFKTNELLNFKRKDKKIPHIHKDISIYKKKYKKKELKLLNVNKDKLKKRKPM